MDNIAAALIASALTITSTQLVLHHIREYNSFKARRDTITFMLAKTKVYIARIDTVLANGFTFIGLPLHPASTISADKLIELTSGNQTLIETYLENENIIIAFQDALPQLTSNRKEHLLGLLKSLHKQRADLTKELARYSHEQKSKVVELWKACVADLVCPAFLAWLLYHLPALLQSILHLILESIVPS